MWRARLSKQIGEPCGERAVRVGLSAVMYICLMKRPPKNRSEIINCPAVRCVIQEGKSAQHTYTHTSTPSTIARAFASTYKRFLPNALLRWRTHHRPLLLSWPGMRCFGTARDVCVRVIFAIVSVDKILWIFVVAASLSHPCVRSLQTRFCKMMNERNGY